LLTSATPRKEGATAAVCSSVCTPLDEATLEAAVANVTRALAATDDPLLAAEFVVERRSMREELKALRENAAGAAVIDLHRR
jgi:hypothetical protein